MCSRNPSIGGQTQVDPKSSLAGQRSQMARLCLLFLFKLNFRILPIKTWESEAGVKTCWLRSNQLTFLLSQTKNAHHTQRPYLRLPVHFSIHLPDSLFTLCGYFLTTSHWILLWEVCTCVKMFHSWFNKDLKGQCQGRRGQAGLPCRERNSGRRVQLWGVTLKTHRKSGTQNGEEVTSHMADHR